MLSEINEIKWTDTFIRDTAYYPTQALSVFKAGSTVPVKFQLKDASGNPVEASVAPVWLSPQRDAVMASSTNESVYTGTGSNGTTFVWQGDHYQYNWNTKNMSCGYWYRLGVRVGDGSTQFVTIGLK